MLANKQQKQKPGLLNYRSRRWSEDEGTERFLHCREQYALSGKDIEIENINKSKNSDTMKPKMRILRWMLLMLLMTGAGEAWAQGPYPNQGAHNVCLGDVAPYGVINTPGSTYTWTIIPLTGGNGEIAPGNSNLTSVNWNSVGTCNLQVLETTSQGCTGAPVQILITVTLPNTITLTSAASTEVQTVNLNTPITDITYATTGTTAPAVTGLPEGVSGSWTANVLTITGTPTVSGTFNYQATLSGDCGTVTSTGVITVTAGNTIILTSAAGTDAQTLCINTAITTITYTTTGATAGTVTDLPAGVTGTWEANTVTITGTPTVSGTFNYHITLTGGFGTVTATGTITVNPRPSPAIIGSNPIVCQSANNNTEIYTTANVAGNSYNWIVIGGTFTGQNTNQIAVTWTTAGPGSVSVTETDISTGCSATDTMVINIQAAPTTSGIYHN